MIEIRGISFSAGDFRVRDVNLRVADGEVLVLLGPNGSGKTLLASAVCGLVRPERGAILVGGRDVTRLEPRLRHVGYVPQDYGLFPHLSVGRNVTYGLRARGRDAAEAEPVTRLLGLERLLDRRPRTLSGGERQKVALARALVVQPRVLVLDEPLGALDTPTRREVLDQLRRIKRELAITTLHVCHNLDEARAVADRVGVMIGGRLAQVGTLDDVTARPVGDDVARALGCD